jgi:hypothetical protein
MEIHWFFVVGSRETYVHVTIAITFSLTNISSSGLWKEHSLVRHSQTVVISKRLPLRQLYYHKRYSLSTRQRSGLNGLFLLRL